MTQDNTTRADPEKERVFTVEIGKLRILSNEMRKEQHERIINWVDESPFRDGSSGKSLTFVLPTRGCKYAMAKHGGCSMCTLPMDNPLNPTTESLYQLPERTWEIFEKKGGVAEFRGVKFYTSGSYLDPWELPVDLRRAILAKFVDNVDEITIETRCEFVIKKHIEDILEVVPAEKLIVAIGQETTDDEINKRSVNKGHKRKQFERAVKLLHQYNVQVKGYILLKSIFMSEVSSLDDVLRSAKHMNDIGVQNISINPCYIGKKTLMEQMFYRGTYRPPWLWTVYYAAKAAKQLVGDRARVICDPVAAGSERGPRNCGSCDKALKATLKEFSSTQDLSLLDIELCECHQIYTSVLSTEHLANGMGTTSVYH
ncbi:MAG: archaeosine biosynthesis radical SAM protein RaSEA [Candidatus Kariarchaeaceae archaeon]|jgi:radical SAM enzyme (TIGR01210 family)